MRLIATYCDLSFNYDVNEPAQQFGVVDRDHVLMSIPTGKVAMKNMQYVARGRLMYYKETPIQLTTKLNFDYEYNEAAGAMTYDRVITKMPAEELCKINREVIEAL